jgi:hypothetical protein
MPGVIGIPVIGIPVIGMPVIGIPAIGIPAIGIPVIGVPTSLIGKWVTGIPGGKGVIGGIGYCC